MAKAKLNWKKLNPAAFPVDVQKAVTETADAISAHYAACKKLPSFKTMQDATTKVDKMLQTYADRIKVDGVILKLAGENLKFAVKRGNLIAASVKPSTSTNADTELA